MLTAYPRRDSRNDLSPVQAHRLLEGMSFDGLFSSLTGKPTTLSGYGIVDAQPLDSDLTAIAGLVTTSFGREVLTKSDAASIRTYIGAGSSSFDGAFSSLSGKPTTLIGYGITDAFSGAYADLSGKPTLGTAAASNIVDFASAVHTHTFASLTSTPTTLTGYGISDAQPLDTDLTALAALTTDAFGRGVLTQTSAGNVRTYIGAGTSSFDGVFASLTSKPTTVAGYGITDFNSLGDARWSVLAHTHTFASLTSKPTDLLGFGITDAQPLDSDLTAIAALSTTAFGRDVLIKADAAAVRTYIGAGTSSFDGTFTALTGKPTTIASYGITDFNSLGDARWQLLDSDLTTLAGLTATTDNFIVSVASAWASRTPAQVRTTLGLVIGTNVQAYDADLTTWAGITPASGAGTFLATPTLANLSALVSDADIARTDAAQSFTGTQTFSNIDVTNGTWHVMMSNFGIGSTWAGLAFNASPSLSNYSFLGDGGSATYMNAPTGGEVGLRINNGTLLLVNAAGTAITGNLTATNNLGVGATGWGTSAAKVLGIGNGTEPSTSPADMVQLYSVDLSAGNATLGIRTERAVVTESVVSDRTLSVRINGTTYKLCLKV